MNSAPRCCLIARRVAAKVRLAAKVLGIIPFNVGYSDFELNVRASSRTRQVCSTWLILGPTQRDIFRPTQRDILDLSKETFASNTLGPIWFPRQGPGFGSIR
jgi:hypothetical protein